MRCELKHNFTTKWVKSEQQLADILTKELSGKNSTYARIVFESNYWTCGPDDRCVSTRGRKLKTPDAGERVQAEEEEAESFTSMFADWMTQHKFDEDEHDESYDMSNIDTFYLQAQR